MEITHLSGKALFHLDAHALKHKLLAIDERDGAKQADYSLRILLSAGRLITKVATKDPASGKLRTDTNAVQGPVAVLITTTDPDTDAETRSRFILASIDESSEQTRAITEFQWRRHTLAGLTSDRSRHGVLRRHHAFQRLLQPIPVVFPSAKCLDGVDDRLSSRRDLSKILRLVQAVALLRQFQKPINHHEGLDYLEVDEEDWRLATPMIAQLFGSPWRDLSQPSRELLRKLADMRAAARTATPLRESFVFTRREARDYTGLPNTTLHRYLAELIEFEYVGRDSADHRQRHRYRLDWEPAPSRRATAAADCSNSIPRRLPAATATDQTC